MPAKSNISDAFLSLGLWKRAEGASGGPSLEVFCGREVLESGKGVDFNLYLGVLRSSLAFVPGVRSVFFVNLYKEYTSLKSRELEELPRFVVMIWQPFMLLRSASLCLFRITLCMQRYDFVSYKTKVS